MVERARVRRSNVGAPTARRVVRKLILSEAETMILETAARRVGMSLQAYLIDTGLHVDNDVSRAERRELVEGLLRVQHLLSTVANNVNQVAKVANRSQHVPAEWGRLVDEVRAVVRLAGTEIDRLARS